MFAPDLLGLPEARMRQALGLTLFTGLLGLMLRIPTGRRHHE